MGFRYLLLVIACIFLTRSSSGQDFTAIDSFAKNAPANIDQDSSTIATYLLKGCKTDMEKARAAFTWIAWNIRYDDNAYNSGKVGDMSPKSVLHRRHAVCEGYANLYKAIAQAMGLEAERIDGYAKAYGYRPGQKFVGTEPNHSWNAVKINGEWDLLDATWGAGHAEGERGRLTSRKEFTPYWFNVNKYEFLFLHYPKDEKWLLLPQPVTLQQYQEMPHVRAELFQLGFDAHSILDQSFAKTMPKELPLIYATKFHVKLVDFPLNGTIAATDEASFTIISDEDVEIALFNAPKQIVRMEKSGNKYTAKVPLKRGDLHVGVRGKTGSYSDVITYKVK